MTTATAKPRDENIVAPHVRDLDVLAGELKQWLAAKLPGASDLRIENLAYPKGAGMSHETILFDAAWNEGGAEKTRGLVVRIKPSRNPVFLDDMFDAQYALMKLMDEDGHVRVAKPLWLEHDPSLLGAPFFIMEKVHGRVPITNPSYATAGWLFEATPAQRAVLWEDSTRQLASIQKTSVSTAPFLSTGAPVDGFGQELDRWERYMAWAAGMRKQPLTYHQKVFDHLTNNLPDNRPEGIVWGDSRLGNMMFGDDYKVVAVMDWEQPSLGGALHDLGWWMRSEDMRTFTLGVPTLPGMRERADTVALWEEVSGKSAADLDWYIDFAAFKMLCLGAKMSYDRDPSAPAPDWAATPMAKYFIERFGW